MLPTLLSAPGLTSRRSTEGPSNVGHIGNDRLDAIALAFNFGLQQRHAGEGFGVSQVLIASLYSAHSPVTIELVVDVATDVDYSHDGSLLKKRMETRLDRMMNGK